MYGKGVATRKVTFTLDEKTIRQLEEVSDLLSKPYRQRIRILHVFDALVPKIPPRTRREVDAELREIC